MHARWIHDHGERRDAPFVGVDCASLRGELLASALFGHVRGAFTSAVEAQQGLIEVADGGTLFLDEVADMDILLQAQFLKLVEEKRFRKVGDTKERQSDFRLICATNRDLQEEISRGHFRNDLFHRVNVFPIVLPPVRERTEDIPDLACALLESAYPGDWTFESGVPALLTQYSWQGNIREMKNVLERAVVLARGRSLALQHFPGLTCPEDNWRFVTPQAESLNLAEMERTLVRAALERHHGDVARAAEALGISRATLYRQMKKNGLES